MPSVKPVKLGEAATDKVDPVNVKLPLNVARLTLPLCINITPSVKLNFNPVKLGVALIASIELTKVKFGSNVTADTNPLVPCNKPVKVPSVSVAND